MIKEKISDVRSYRSRSYDFPEIMKVFLVGLATAIPLILSFFGSS